VNCVTPGDSYFIRRTFIFTYLSFAIFKYCGEILEAQIQALEAQREAAQQRIEAMEAVEAQSVAEQHR
jgi:hypothetical protein